MIEYIRTLVKITCDKCGDFDTARKSNHGEIFNRLGWKVKPRARKYKHLCAMCWKPMLIQV